MIPGITSLSTNYGIFLYVDKIKMHIHKIKQNVSKSLLIQIIKLNLLLYYFYKSKCMLVNEIINSTKNRI